MTVLSSTVRHLCAGEVAALSNLTVTGTVWGDAGTMTWTAHQLGQPGDVPVRYCPRCGERLPVKLKVRVEAVPA